MFYSKTTSGFYESSFGTNLPSDLVEITREYWIELLDGQSMGKIISSNDEGYPVLIDPPPPSAAELEAIERIWRNNQLAATDSAVSRYRDEVERWPTLLTPAQYIELQTYRRVLRIWPVAGELPLSEHRPPAPEWLASLPE
jgi:hypothetical protein